MRIPDVTSENVRVETGVREKDQVSVHYDPMIAKLIVWGKNRGEALAILGWKLSEFNVAGLDTNIQFIKDLCRHPSFQQGQVHTGFIKEHYQELFPTIQVSSEIAIQAAVASILDEEMRSLRSSLTTTDPFSPFATETGLRLNHTLTRTFRFTVCFTTDDVEVEARYVEPEVYSMRVNRIGPWRRVTGTLIKGKMSLELSTEIDGMITKASIIKIRNKLHLFTKDREWQFNAPPVKFLSNLATNDSQMDPCNAVSPMPGLVEKLFVTKGDVVKIGDALFVINAMKMEHTMKATINGTVENVLCSIGDNVPKNKLLVKLVKSA